MSKTTTLNVQHTFWQISLESLTDVKLDYNGNANRHNFNFVRNSHTKAQI